MKTYLLPFLFIALVAFFVFSPSFSMALFGDDWLAFYRYRYHYGIWSHGLLYSINYFFSPYGMQDLWMGILEQFFGLSSTPYYVVSLLLRLLAVFGLYFIIKRFTDSGLAACLGSLFFAVSSIGLDATNWVFNMPSYLAIFCMALFFYFLVLSQDEMQRKKVAYAGIFYYLSFVAAPIRMHVIPLLAFAIDIVWVLKNPSKKILKRVLFRQLYMIAVFIVLRNSGYLLGNSDEATGRIQAGIAFLFSSLTKGDYVIILNPFIIVGRLLIPESVWPFITPVFSTISFRTIFISSTFIFLPFVLYYYQIVRNKKLILLAFAILLSWGFLVKYALAYNVPILRDPSISGAALLGGYLIFFTILFSFSIISKSPTDLLKSKFILFSLLWILLSFAYPYIWTPQSLFGTYHRYFITTGAGLALLLAGLVSLATSWQQKTLIVITLLLFISTQSFVTYSFFKNLIPLRGQEISDHIWNSVPKVPAIEKRETPLVFYFEGNSAILYHVITFGFPPHIAILYNIEDGGKLPIATTDWNEVVEMVTKGEKLGAYGFPKEPLNVENVYAFKLNSDGTLEDITINKRSALRLSPKSTSLQLGQGF